MLLFFSIILVILIIILILNFSEIRLTIDKLEYSNNNQKSLPNYEGAISLYFLGKVKLFGIRINNNKVEKTLRKRVVWQRIEKIKEANYYQKKIQKKMQKEVIKVIKKRARIKTFKLQMYVDTESVVLTSYIVGIISAVIPNLIRNNMERFNYNNYKIEILPIYKKQNHIYLNLSSIISIKVVHIINMFKVMGGIKNERSSNRRLNVNCYGKY